MTKHPMSELAKLVEKGYRVNKGLDYDNTLEAYAAGRNDMVDVIRALLRGEDVSEHYPIQLPKE